MIAGPEAPFQILVVEDDPDASALLEVVLRRRGWNATFVSDLEQAKAALETDAFCALITDLTLPDGSGLSLLSNGRPPTLRAAVVMTGWGGAARAESLKHGFDAYVVKPFDSTQFVHLVEKLLSGPKGTTRG